MKHTRDKKHSPGKGPTPRVTDESSSSGACAKPFCVPRGGADTGGQGAGPSPSSSSTTHRLIKSQAKASPKDYAAVHPPRELPAQRAAGDSSSSTANASHVTRSLNDKREPRAGPSLASTYGRPVECQDKAPPPPTGGTRKRSAAVAGLGKECLYCHSLTHLVKDCPNKRSRKSYCNYCNVYGHWSENCEALTRWLSKCAADGLSETQRLEALHVPDHTGMTVEVDLARDNFMSIAAENYDKFARDYGAYIVRPKVKVIAPSLSSMPDLIVTPKKQTTTPNGPGGFVVSSEVATPRPYKVFLEQSVKHAAKLKKSFDRTKPFWHAASKLLKTIGNSKMAAEYVMDLEYTLFPTKSRNLWHMNGLRDKFVKHLIKECQVDDTSVADYHRGEKMSGINTIHMLIGQAGSATGWHVDDLNFASVNYLREGEPKYWVVVPSQHEKRVRRLLKELFREDYKTCRAVDHHRIIALLPQHLVLEKIPFHTLKQEPGDYVLTQPGAFHFVVNGGPNVAEATNFSFAKARKHMRDYVFCTCPLKENVLLIKSKMR